MKRLQRHFILQRMCWLAKATKQLTAPRRQVGFAIQPDEDVGLLVQRCVEELPISISGLCHLIYVSYDSLWAMRNRRWGRFNKGSYLATSEKLKHALSDPKLRMPLERST
jgi:hypothetical protein